ncbi:MAG: linoleoyl-CoA desaturase [Myxococcota bacterium]|jgi:hypothetical protein
MAATSSELDPEQLKRFGKAIDVIRKKAHADVGHADLRYVRRPSRFSTAMEGVGRVLIHVSLESVSFSLGVAAL